MDDFQQQTLQVQLVGAAFFLIYPVLALAYFDFSFERMVSLTQWSYSELYLFLGPFISHLVAFIIIVLMENLFLIDFGGENEALIFGLTFLGFIASQLLGNGFNYLGGIIGVGALMVGMGFIVFPLIPSIIFSGILAVAIGVVLILAGGYLWVLGYIFFSLALSQGIGVFDIVFDSISNWFDSMQKNIDVYDWLSLAVVLVLNFVIIELVAFVPQNGTIAALLGLWTLPVPEGWNILKENGLGVLIAALSIILFIKYGYMVINFGMYITNFILPDMEVPKEAPAEQLFSSQSPDVLSMFGDLNWLQLLVVFVLLPALQSYKLYIELNYFSALNSARDKMIV